MDTNSSTNSFIFPSFLALVVALILSVVAYILKDNIDKNIDLDQKKNILVCAGFDVSILKPDSILVEYENLIDEIFINNKGEIVSGFKKENLSVTEDKKLGAFIYKLIQSGSDSIIVYPLYQTKKSSSIQSVIIPISGKGLWSTLYGYIALEKDMVDTVKNITFYKHGETPGLGGEVNSERFQLQFKSIDKNGDIKKAEDRKTIFSENALESITLVKPGLPKNKHQVDGLSGATVTSDGVTDFLKRDLQKYKPYFDRQRSR